MKKLLALEFPPDGVFCYNDPTAMGAIQYPDLARQPRRGDLPHAGNVFHRGAQPGGRARVAPRLKCRGGI
ncbi:MAG: hypothetical protein NTW28_04880 [Candidatus Solibacter sp.]|nr:hypothetical protein [Candidatus Solibacter sp.]